MKLIVQVQNHVIKYIIAKTLWDITILVLPDFKGGGMVVQGGNVATSQLRAHMSSPKFELLSVHSFTSAFSRLL